MHLAPDVRDQGLRGTCAAFVGAGIKSMHYKKMTGVSLQLSPEFIYYHRENKPSNGMYGRNVFQVLQKIGVPEETDHPYNNTKKPSRMAYQRAQNFKISNYARITTLDGLKRALYELGPCYLLVPLYAHRPEFWKNENNEKCDKTHAVLVAGYNDYGFTVINSWGDDWGAAGTTTIPYDDWSDTWEIWVCMDGDIEEIIPVSKLKKMAKKYRKQKRKGFQSLDSSDNEPLIKKKDCCLL